MNNFLGRRAWLKMAGAGVLGAAARVLESVAPATANAQTQKRDRESF